MSSISAGREVALLMASVGDMPNSTIRGGAFTVALTCGRIGRRPIGVVDSQSRTIPGTLLQHLGNRRIIEIKPMLDGIAASVQGTMQADSAISMAGYFLAPSVGFIHHGLHLFDCEGRLRNQFAVSPDPRPMGHVHLDPVSAVVKLFARCLARFDRTVNELRSFWHV